MKKSIVTLFAIVFLTSTYAQISATLKSSFGNNAKLVAQVLTKAETISIVRQSKAKLQKLTNSFGPNKDRRTYREVDIKAFDCEIIELSLGKSTRTYVCRCKQNCGMDKISNEAQIIS